MRGLIDSTLREGEQQARLYFTTEQKLGIIGLLCEVGVEEIEIGIASADSDLAVMMDAARMHGPGRRISIWCRFCKEDISLAAYFRPDGLSMALPVSDLHLGKRLGKDRIWAIDRIGTMASVARQAGVEYISLGLEDATRASPDFLDRVVAEAISSGFDRIRLCDTLGLSTPARMASLVKRYSGRSIEIAVHTHNDFGMATANAITALDSGADWADATVLGIGERAGIANLEVLAGFLNLRRNKTCYNLLKVNPLMTLVAAATGEAVQHRHPVFGPALFECETGIHLDGLHKDASTYEPFPPEAVGANRSRHIGMKAGRNAVFQAAAERRLPIDEAGAAAVCASIRSRSRDLGRPLTEDEFAEVVSLRRG